MARDATEMVGELRPGKALQEEFGEKLGALYKINGKRVSEWRSHFSIDVPLDPSLQQVKEFLVKISNLHQEAVYLKSDAQLRHSLLLSTRNRKYNEAFVATLDEYKSQDKKVPAKDVVVSMAETKVADLDEALAHADAANRFFQNIISILTHHRSVLESIVMDLGIEAKLAARNS